MSLARGIMNFGRLTIYQTTTTISNISPTTAVCGDTVIFTVDVTNNTSGGPIPNDGIVSIINIISNTVVGTGSLISGTVTINTTPGVSMGKYIAIYNGVHNFFESSMSAITNYNIIPNNTVVTVLTSSDLHFCYTQSVPISAHIDASSGTFPTGSVRFKLYSDNTDFIELSSGTLNGSGDVTSVIPSFTTVDGYDYWLQALYDGYGCWNSSESLPGMSGKILHSISNNSTTTTANISGSTTFCAHEDIILISDTSSSLLAAPSIGSINFTSTDGYTILNLGTTSIINGSASLLIPAGTFNPGTHWNVTAHYIGDGYCYGDSVSSGGLLLSPSVFNTNTTISGPISFCFALDEIFNVGVSSSFIGDLTGTVTLDVFSGAELVTTFGPFDVEGHSMDVILPITITRNTTRVGNLQLRATFISKAGNCYNGSVSSNFDVTVLNC